VAFGLGELPPTAEPHRLDPIDIQIGAGRVLRLQGRIDRIDVRPDGALVLRDYKTGRVPRQIEGALRSGAELQIPIYAAAVARILPGRSVGEAFLDYVDSGRFVPVETPPDGEARLGRLLGELTSGMAAGLFLQEPAACEWCDFTAVCGPRSLLDLRRQLKLGDPQLERYLRARGTA
jgi:putative RecB family exonuclease